jgi:hypothetical protein
MPHMGGDIPAMKSLLASVSDRAMYLTIAEQQS